jgi:hypothetical protein
MIDNQHVYGHAQFGHSRHVAQTYTSFSKGKKVYSDDSWLETYYEDRNDSLYFTPPYVPYEDEEHDWDEDDDEEDLGMPDSFGGDLESDYSGSWQDSDNSDALVPSSHNGRIYTEEY